MPPSKTSHVHIATTPLAIQRAAGRKPIVCNNIAYPDAFNASLVVLLMGDSTFPMLVANERLTRLLVPGTDALSLTDRGVLKVVRKATMAAGKARRLTSEERAEILRLHAAGRTKKDIADTIQTTVPTVARTIGDAQNGSPTTIRTRRATVSTTAHDQDLTMRLKALAVAVVMEGSVDEDEKSALKEIIEQRIAEAQSRAAREALASL